MTKELKIGLTLALIVILMLGLVMTMDKGNTGGSDDVLAVINGQKITEKEFMEYLEPYKKDIMYTITDTILVEQKAKELGITITPKDVESELQEYRNHFDTEDDFLEVLESNNSSIDQLKYNIKQKEDIDKIIEKLSQDLEVTKEEVQEQYEYGKKDLALYDLTLLIMNDEEKFDELQQRVSSGENFDTLVKNFGEEGSGNKEGVRHYELELPEEIFEMEEGQVYPDPVSNYMGNLYVRLDKKMDKIEDLQDSIKQQIQIEKGYQEFNQLMTEYRDESDIEYNL